MSSAALPTQVMTRPVDLLDVAVANAMLAVAGLPPLRCVVEGRDRLLAHATETQRDALHVMAWQAVAVEAEAWMRALAPRLVAGVVDIVGGDWLAEAECGVELAVALRAEDMAAFANELSRGPVLADASASAAAVIAVEVPHADLVRFL